MAAQADGHPLLPLDFEPVDRRVEHLVGFGLGSAQKVGDLHRRVVLLRNDQFHGTILLLGRVMRPSRSHDLPHLEIFTCAGFCLGSRAALGPRECVGPRIHDLPQRGARKSLNLRDPACGSISRSRTPRPGAFACTAFAREAAPARFP